MTGMDDELTVSAWHESGHCLAASLFGQAGAATVTPGAVWVGCSAYVGRLVPPTEGFDPGNPGVYPQWPHGLRRRLEADVMVALSGDLAESMLTGPRAGRVAGPVSARAAEAAEKIAGERLAPATPEELAEMASAVDEPQIPTDAEAAGQLAVYACGHDPAARAAFLAWMEVSARLLLAANSLALGRLADALLERGALGAEAVRAVLAG
jgi:hypothetical protein